MAPAQQPRWDIFCRVVDNLGDAGVCWRLAADLAARGRQVRLVIDDAGPLAFMAPDGAPGVQVVFWPQDDAPWGTELGPPGDVVIEAFGCDPPPAFVQAMLQRPPVWINLEYLSAEAYVERSHGLPSPQRSGLLKHFFYPGFAERTGGLLREAGLLDRQGAFDRNMWLQALGAAPRPRERVVSLFCYDNPALPALLHDLAAQPTLLLLTPGHAQRQVFGQDLPATLRLHALPWLTQADFDHLLWAADLNLVRGEDSLVRALWAGAPFLWQAYPQHDGAHAAKLDAMLARLQLPQAAAQAWRAWNQLQAWPGLPGFAAGQPWAAASAAARQRLLLQADLTTQLLRFVEQVQVQRQA